MDRKSPRQRRAITVQGIVQGVGFRPFVHRTALNLGLSGFVRNQSGYVYLELEGSAESLSRFAAVLAQDAPPLARIDSVTWYEQPAQGTSGFQIVESTKDSSSQVFIAPDMATCVDCLAELFDPKDRRYRYPFLNCTNCGPRLTIIESAPYDRQRTTMSAFAMCAACRREFDDPTNRRFHAQPTACPECGPQLQLLNSRGQKIESTNPLGDFTAAIRSGMIGAMKGLGGYHLVCDATIESAVAELRRRKHRDQKPFAVMVGTAEDADRLCELNSTERSLLSSARRPIVLLRVRAARNADVARSLAPGNPYLGLMLPYTPLHHLLLEAMDGGPLVMTSGNRSDEPIAYDDDDAIDRLAEIVDIVLTNNRRIHVRCDDSVTRCIDGRESLIRRSRGYAPESLSLPIALHRPTLAVGGQLKATFALGCERSAFLSHHLGDLDHFAAYQAFERDIGLYENLFDTRPELVVHDLHPDYASSGYAQRRSRTERIRCLAVQHHHAHVASCMAEHGLTGRVIGVAFDGTGYGTDGAIWGGEFLVATYAEFQRAAHLRYVGLPGGDAAIREPWRIAMAHLIDAGCDFSYLADSVANNRIQTIEQMVIRQINAPLTSSMGRLFDAVAAMIGVRTQVSFEGQAAMELEWLATRVAPDRAYPFDVIEEPSASAQPRLIVDTRPLIRAIDLDRSSRQDKCLIARRFHSTIVDILNVLCQKMRSTWNLEQIVLSGGVFMNSLLVKEASQQLSASGFQVYWQHAVPCNDGGLSLGQLAIAAACDSAK